VLGSAMLNLLQLGTVVVPVESDSLVLWDMCL
jgi:hypothetical protein